VGDRTRVQDGKRGERASFLSTSAYETQRFDHKMAHRAYTGSAREAEERVRLVEMALQVDGLRKPEGGPEQVTLL
jgi:hypothetical protein